MPKKYRRMMQNGPKMMPKWSPKSMIFRFFEKLWFFENHSFPLGITSISAIGGVQKIRKNEKKRCRKDAWKSDAKMMRKLCQNGAKIDAKIDKKGQKCRKKACRKWSWNLMPFKNEKNDRKWQNQSTLVDPRVDFLAVWGFGGWQNLSESGDTGWCYNWI